MLGGGRTWWAHFEFTRINIALTILQKDIEENTDVLDAGGFVASTHADALGRMASASPAVAITLQKSHSVSEWWAHWWARSSTLRRSALPVV